MSRPKFQSRDAKLFAPSGIEPLGRPWTNQSVRAMVEKIAADLPPASRPFYNVDDATDRAIGRRRHVEYLRRTGGTLDTEWADVPLHWFCCDQWETIGEIHRDRHGNLRPEDQALIRARAYYHRCP